MAECKGKAKACCVGINYIGTDNALKGCINDARNSRDKFEKMAKNAGYDDIETKLITDETEVKPTHDDILRAANWLVDGAKPGDLLWWHFSGHGTQVADRDGDEKDGKDEAICPVDLKMINDDTLKKFLCGTLPEGVTLYAIFDCCHSGTIVDLHYVWDEDNNEFVRDSWNAQTHGDIFMLSGCMNVQTSADLPPGWEANIKESVGALTNGILNNIEKGYSWATFVKEVRRSLKSSKLTQIPQFEVGRLQDANQPAFQRLLPNGVEPVPPPEDLPPMDPVNNHRIDDLHNGEQGPHDNDNDFLPFSDLSGFASILMQKGMAMLMGGGGGGGGGDSGAAGMRSLAADEGNQKAAKGLLAKLFSCCGSGATKPQKDPNM